MVKRLGLLCVCLLISRWALALSVTTTVEPDRVRPGESVVVTYETDGQAGDPDFTPLQEDFEIVDQRQSQNITVVNGQANYEMVWNLALMPRRAGELSLPSIDFGGAFSATRTVVVEAEPSDGSAKTPATGQAADPTGDMFVEYSVDDATPYANQQVLLTTQVYTAVEVEDLSVSEPQAAEGEAEIDKLGRVREYQSTRNGRRYTVREQRYTLVPQTTGVLKLSPLEVSGRIGDAPVTRRVDPPRIEVISTAGDSRGTRELDPDDLFVEVELDKRSPYVQEQVIFTVRLFRAIAIENASLGAPDVSGGDAVIERIGDDRRYQSTRNNKRYAVTERRFVLFPQTSGKLTLEPIRLQAAIPVAYNGGGSTGFWSRPLTRPVQIQSRPHELDVKTPPDGAPLPWLPSSALTLEEDWPQRDDFEVGAPITRRITVTAEQMLASQLPTVDAPLPSAIKSYPEKPSRSTSAGEQGVTGRLEQTVTLIPSQAGTFTVPAFELKWWNTEADRLETLRLPAHIFQVAAAPGSAGTEAGEPGSGGVTVSKPGAWPDAARWLSLGLACAWLATLVMWWLDRRHRAGEGGDPPERTVETRRRAEKRLRAACNGADPHAARDALLAWGWAQWPDLSLRSLGALARVTDDGLAAQIAALQQVLYAPGDRVWQGEDLYRAVVSSRRAGADDGGDGALKPLYQH